jgi:hypothetical protein
MAKAMGMAKVKEKDLAEFQRPVRMQGQGAGAGKGTRQQAEGSKQKRERASAKGGTRRRGRAHLPNPELDDLNWRFLIERLSMLDQSNHWENLSGWEAHPP